MRRMSWLLFVTGLCFIFSVSLLNAQAETCPGSLPPRLIVGQMGRVTPGDANNVRGDASPDAELTGQIPGAAAFNVLEGPVCNSNRTWWKVEYQGLVGWTVEGSTDSYWLEPVEQTPLPEQTDTSQADTILPTSVMTLEGLTQYTRRRLDFTAPTFAQWSPDGRWLVVNENDGIWVIDQQSGTGGVLLIRRADEHYGTIVDILFDNTLLMRNRSQFYTINPETGERRDIPLEGTDAVRGSTVSPDGTLMLFRQSEMISLMDLQTLEVRWSVPLGELYDSILIAISFDNRLIAAYIHNQDASSLQLINAADGTVYRSLSLLKAVNSSSREPVYSLQFNPDGTQLAGANDEVVLIWDTVTGTKQAALTGGDPIHYSRDGKLLLSAENYYEGSGREEDYIKVWDSHTGEHLALINSGDQGYYGLGQLQMNADGSRFISLPENYNNQVANLFMWELNGKGTSGLVEIETPSDTAVSGCPSTLESRLTAAMDARVQPTVSVINMRAEPTLTASVVSVLEGRTVVKTLGETACTLGTVWQKIQYEDKTGWVVEAQAGEYLLEPFGGLPETPQYTGDPKALLGGGEIQNTLISPDGKWIAVQSSNGVWLYQADKLDETPTLLYMNQEAINNMVFSDDSTMLAVGTGRHAQGYGNAWVWDLNTMTVRVNYESKWMVNALDISEDGKYLIISGGQLVLWNIEDAYAEQVIDDFSSSEVHFSPIWPYVFTVNWSFSASLWNIEQGVEIAQFSDGGGLYQEPFIGSPVLSPDGMSVLGIINGTINFFSGTNGNFQTYITKTDMTDEDKDSYILCTLAFSADNQWLASGGDKLRLWDITFNSPTVLREELPKSDHDARCKVGFSPDGSQIAWGNYRETELWSFDSLTPLTTVKGQFAAFTPSGDLLTYNASGVYIWNAEGEAVATLKG